MVAKWNLTEPKERNPIRWVNRRWLRLGRIDKGLTLLPVIGIALALSISSLSGAILLAAFAMVVGLYLAMQPGHSGYEQPERLTMDPPVVPEVEVDVIVKREGVLLGEDHGKLSEADGWLVFTGHRTSFSIRSQHCGSVGTEDRTKYEKLFGRGEWTVLHLRKHERVDVLLRPRPAKDEGFFTGILSRWRQDRVVTNGEPVFPPLSPHPEAFIFPRAKLANNTFFLIVWLILLSRSNGEANYLDDWSRYSDWGPIYIGIPILFLFGFFEGFGSVRKLRRFRLEAQPADPVARPNEELLADRTVKENTTIYR